MGKRYYCDFCDKSFSDNIQSRKRHFQGLSHQRQRKAHYDQFKHELLAKEHAKKFNRVPQSTGQEILTAWLARNPQVVERAKQRGIEVNLPDVVPPQLFPNPQQTALAFPPNLPIVGSHFPAIQPSFPPLLMSPTQPNVAFFSRPSQGIPSNLMFPSLNVSGPGGHPPQSGTYPPGSHPGTHPPQSGTYPPGSDPGTHAPNLGTYPTGLSLMGPSSSSLTSQMGGSQSNNSCPQIHSTPGSQSGSHLVGASSSLPHPLFVGQNQSGLQSVGTFSTGPHFRPRHF